jgi:3'(2'), 5'-bisphosphate nucleotidase
VYERELKTARETARAAGRVALAFYGKALHVERKGTMDEPVTEADYAANRIIVEALGREFPGDGLLSEETTDTGERLRRERVWIVDPLDGTNGFIDGTGDFAVQIGLAEAGKAVIGVVYLPLADVMYWAARDAGAWVERGETGEPERMHVSKVNDVTEMRLAASRSHRSPRMDAVIDHFKFKDEVRSGSVGIKIGLIAERRTDLYIHLSSRSKQWDTCAPECILAEAGGRLTDLFGSPIRYNTPDIQNHNGLVATNSVAHKTIIEGLAPLMRKFGRKKV